MTCPVTWHHNQEEQNANIGVTILKLSTSVSPVAAVCFHLHVYPCHIQEGT